jgi:purine-binding chemotaxis protein CheW
MSAVVQIEAQSRSGFEDHGQYLTFMLGKEVFAIGILAIKEIIEYGHLTTVPMMPECIRGVINLRGAVVPVVDLAVRFGREPSLPTRRTCIVIIEVHMAEQETQVVGVTVDAVNEVMEIASTQIEPAPNFGTHIRTDFIRGMGKIDDRFVIILNVDRVLSAADLAVLAGDGPGLEGVAADAGAGAPIAA